MSSNRSRRADASYRRRGPPPTRFPPRSRAPGREYVRANLSNLVVEKTAEYERRKQQVIKFTEQVMKRRIKGMVRSYISNNRDTIMDFITQLNYHPSVDNAFVAEELPAYMYIDSYLDFRCIIDVKLPKTALPTDTRNPLPNELQNNLRSEIVQNIMQYAAPTTSSTKRRIIVDIGVSASFKVQHIVMPTQIYSSGSVEYWSTFRDPGEGIRSHDTGLEHIRIIEMGLRNDVILAILENLNGKNYCKTVAFRKICEKIRGDLNQTMEELLPHVVFPQPREYGPELQNTDPMISGYALKHVNVVKFLPVLLSGFHRYCDSEIEKNARAVPPVESKILVDIVKKLDTITKGVSPAERRNDFLQKYKCQKVIKVSITPAILWRNLLAHFLYRPYWERKLAFDNYLASPHADYVYKFIDDSEGRSDPSFLQPDVIYTILTEFAGPDSVFRQDARNTRIGLLLNEEEGEVTIQYKIPVTHAVPINISPSDVVNVSPIDESRIPPGHVVAEVIRDAGKRKSHKRKSRRRKSHKRKLRRRKSHKKKSHKRKSKSYRNTRFRRKKTYKNNILSNIFYG